MLSSLILASLILFPVAKGSTSDVYLGIAAKSVPGSSSADAYPVFIGRRFLDVPEDNQFNIQRQSEQTFFRTRAAAKAWLVPPPQLNIDVFRRSRKYLQTALSGRGSFTRVVRDVDFRANITINYIFPATNPGSPTLDETIKMMPGELVIYADDAELTRLRDVEPSQLLNQIKIFRPEIGSPRITVGQDLRYRLSRVIPPGFAPNDAYLEMTFRFTDGEERRTREVPLFAWSSEDGGLEFRHLFHLTWSRYIDRPYLARRCAESLGRGPGPSPLLR